MNKFIAHCGLDCEHCEARIATINNDDTLREKVAIEWGKMNGMEFKKEWINCEGCRLDGIKCAFCDDMCEIKKCCIKHGFQTCSECTQKSGCKTLKMITSHNKNACKNLKIEK